MAILQNLNPLDEQWFNAGNVLKTELLEYDWKYREKICSKCPIETQKRLNCFRVDNYRMIHGKQIQETHCKKMDKARTAKFRGRFDSFLNLPNPFINDGSTTVVTDEQT